MLKLLNYLIGLKTLQLLTILKFLHTETFKKGTATFNDIETFEDTTGLYDTEDVENTETLRRY